MKQLPKRPDLQHLKKQAKDILRLYKGRDSGAFDRFRSSLPVANGKTDLEIAALDLRLHDAQSCVAREYGFPSWLDLKNYVEAQAILREAGASRIMNWLHFVYAGDIAGNSNGPQPLLAARLLAENPNIAGEDVYLACAVGEEDALRRATNKDPDWVNRPGGPLKLPPLVAVTHSSLLQLPDFRERLHRSAKLLLEAGANPNQSVGNRFPPASLQHPSEECKLSALYGAAGQHHDVELTRLLLDAGADPNDGESLYHSLENVVCVHLLLEAGARIEGSNSLYRALDLLQYGLTEPANLLKDAGASGPVSDNELFIAACARGDENEARRLQALNAGLPASLPETQLRLLPELAAEGARGTVQLMLKLGWPVAAPGGNWNASALNHAVARGDATLTRFLLDHGVSWRKMHGFGDNVCGTLSWASWNEPADGGDWLGCAEALVAFGMPTAEPDPQEPKYVLIDRRRKRFSEDVTAFLLGVSDT